MIRDSIVGMAMVLELLAKRGQALSAVVDAMPRYVICKRAIELPLDQREAAVEAVASKVTGERVDTQDGVRIDWADRWLHVRPSNTEPIVRIIAEASDAPTAEALMDEAQQAMGL
jgi:phosphomannomutase